MTGFLQTPVQPAPDAGPLVEQDQISAVVSRCINVIAEDAASMPLKLHRISLGDKKGMPKEVPDHPALRLWQHINPVETPTVYHQQMYADLVVEGNHYAWVDIQQNTPFSMIRMPPEQVEIVDHPTRIISGYKWRHNDGKTVTYDAQQVIHVRTRNPASIYRGMGFLPRLREQIIFDRSLRQYKLNQIINGVPTTIVFKMKKGFGSEEEFEAFQDRFWKKARGVINVGRPMFFREGDVDIQVIPRPTESEVAVLGNLKYTRNEIAMMFGVPPARLSDYSEAFRANASEQARTFIQDTIMNWHRLFIDYLNHRYLPQFFPREARKLRFAYDYSQVRALAASTKDMAIVNEIAIKNAMRTPNQGAVSIGDEAHDDPKADKLYMHGKPLGEKEKPQPAPEGKPGNKPGDLDPENDGPNGEKPEDAQEEADRLLRTVFERGAKDVDLDHMWIASAVFQRDHTDGAEGKRRVFGTASTARVDRAKTFVNQEFLAKAARKYDKQNGKIFYNHNWQIPAGRRVAIDTRDDKLLLAAEVGSDYNLILKDGPFDAGVLYPVDDLWKLIEQGNVTSFSVAFNADEVQPEKEGDPIELRPTDLFEISIVSIPANPDAEFSVVRAAEHPVFVKMLRGEARPTPRGDEGRGLDKPSDIKFVLEEEDEAALLSRIDEELNKCL